MKSNKYIWGPHFVDDEFETEHDSIPRIMCAVKY